MFYFSDMEERLEAATPCNVTLLMDSLEILVIILKRLKNSSAQFSTLSQAQSTLERSENIKGL